MKRNKKKKRKKSDLAVEVEAKPREVASPRPRAKPREVAVEEEEAAVVVEEEALPLEEVEEEEDPLTILTKTETPLISFQSTTWCPERNPVLLASNPCRQPAECRRTNPKKTTTAWVAVAARTRGAAARERVAKRLVAA